LTGQKFYRRRGPRKLRRKCEETSDEVVGSCTVNGARSGGARDARRRVARSRATAATRIGRQVGWGLSATEYDAHRILRRHAPVPSRAGWYTTLSSPAAGAGWGGRQERAARHPGYPSLVPFPAVGAPRPSRSRATPVGRVLGSPVCASGAEPPPAAGRQLIDERRPPRCRLRAGRHRAARAYACRVANGWCGSSDANAYSV
jgi:hypothetical protein